MAEQHVGVVQDMWEGSMTAVRCVSGVAEGFHVEVGLHEGSALSQLSFARVMG